MIHPLLLSLRPLSIVLLAVVTFSCLCLFSPEVSAQTPFLEFRYEFDTEQAPLEDTTGQYGPMGLGQNGVEHRFGEESLVGGDGFSLGLDAPGINHPTGSYLTIADAPHPESFSFSLWMKPQLTGAVQALVARDNVWWPSPCNFYCLFIDAQQSLVWKTANVENIISEDPIEEDETYHVVVTHLDDDGADTGSAARSRLYLNGELLEEAEDPEEIPSLDAIADANDIYRFLWAGTLSSFGGFWGEFDDFQFYSTELTGEQIAEMYANPGTTASFGGTNGDYNGDGAVNVLDIDLQAGAMKAANPDLATFDEDMDGFVDGVDRLIWVKEHANTWVGDANLDNEFNSGDLVAVFTAGKYETLEMASWAEGDWDGDMAFGSGDLVAAFTDGGYELGAPMAAAVPEPTGLALLLGSLAGLVIYRRRRA